MSTTVTRPVTTPPTAAETALAYVREVRNRFERQPRTYEEFLNVMKDFKSGVLTADNVVTRVRRVFKGHADLLDGFRAFLPEDIRDKLKPTSNRGRGGASSSGRSRHVPGGPGRGRPRARRATATDAGADDAREDEEALDPKRAATLNTGYAFLRRIRGAYADDERPYQAFLQTLIKFRNKQFSAEEVVQKCALLFYDKPHLLEGEDGLETFVPKTCKLPKPSSWFSWSPAVHHRFGSESFRLFVRTLLLCEFKSRTNPPEPKMRRWRLTEGDSSESDSDDYSSSEESETESSALPEKEPGTLRADQIPDCWTGKSEERVLSAFEKLTLELKPMDDEYCWSDTKAAREAKTSKEEIESRGKRGRAEERDYSNTPRESPSPPPSFQKRRASARIIAKVNRGIVYNRYRSLNSPDGIGRGRMRMTRSMSTVDNDLPEKPDRKLEFKRDPSKMSQFCSERIGLHSLPANVVEKIIAYYAVEEGAAELNQIRESLVKSLAKAAKSY